MKYSKKIKSTDIIIDEKKQFINKYNFVIIPILLIFLSFSLSNCKIKDTNKTLQASVEIQNLLLDAQKCLLLNELDQAKEILFDIISKDPKQDVAYYLLSKYYELNNKWDSANKYIDIAIKLSPENVYYLELSANILVKLRKYREAAQRYEILISKNPKILDYYLNAAQMYLIAFMPNNALEIFTKLESQHGFIPEIGFYKYQIYSLLGKSDEALDELWRCIQYDPSNLDYKKEYSSFAIEKGKITALYRLVQWYKQRDSTDGYAALFAANYYFAINKVEELKKELLVAKKDPRVDFQDKLQVILTSIDHPNIDEQFIQQLFYHLEDLHSDKAETFNIIGFYYQAQNILDTAIVYFKKALELDSTNDATYRNLIMSYEAKNDYDSMLFYANKALNFYPDIGEFYFYAGYAAFMQKKFEKCIPHLENALSYIPSKNKELQNIIIELLANAYYETGEYAKAFDYFEKAIKANPANLVLKNNYAYFLAQQDTMMDKALNLIDEVLLTEPTRFSFIDTKAWILFKMKNYDEAKKWIDKALMYNDSDPEILEHAGDIYYHLNLIDDAVQLWQKSKENGNNSEIINKKINDKKYYAF